jgi:hypothetical protein
MDERLDHDLARPGGGDPGTPSVPGNRLFRTSLNVVLRVALLIKSVGAPQDSTSQSLPKTGQRIWYGLSALA